MTKAIETEMGFEAKIKTSVQLLVRTFIENRKAAKWKPDDAAVLKAFIWDAIGTEAKGQSEDAWAAMEALGVYEEPKKTEPIDKMLGATAHFEVHARVTDPVKRFNVPELGRLMLTSKYKIPVHQTVEFVNKAKIGENGNLFLSIVHKA